MSLKSQGLPPVPIQTAQVARAAFPKGHLYLSMRDELGVFYDDAHFAHLFAKRGRPAYAPWRLALITIMQFAENLSDRQAADAVRDRLTWKYVLSLELQDDGFDHTLLTCFRSRLLEGEAEEELLNLMLEHFKHHGLLKPNGQGNLRTDSTHVLGAVRILHRLNCLHETLRAALEMLAKAAPQWLKLQLPPEWYERYGAYLSEFRLPKSQKAKEELALEIGREGYQLLEHLNHAAQSTQWHWLQQLPAVQILRTVWLQQYCWINEQLALRSVKQLPPAAQIINSPYDTEVRQGVKGETKWRGYKVHFSESCAEQTEQLPQLITHVHTTPATTHDSQVLQTVHLALAAKELLPDQHLVDQGYTDAEHLLLARQDYGIELVGPVSIDRSWQAHAHKGYERSKFEIDWAAQKVKCPQGKLSHSWWPTHDEQGQPLILAAFRKKDCDSCPVRSLCTNSKQSRQIGFRPQDQYEILEQRREWQQTAEFKEQYAKRAGVEGTISQAVNRGESRQSRYVGIEKTHLQQVAVAAALNIQRAVSWFAASPRSTTPLSALAALAAPPALAFTNN